MLEDFIHDCHRQPAPSGRRQAYVGAVASVDRELLADKEFRAAAEKRKMMLDPASGDEMDAIVSDTLRLAPAVVDKIGEMMK